MIQRRISIVCVVIVAISTMATSCSKHKAASPATHPDLIAAAKARLGALSTGIATGDAALASSLSSGDVATEDQASARRIGGQITSGDTIDYAFDILSVKTYPLNGGGSDFIAFENGRGHSGGGVFREVEIYHRGTPSSSWKATARSYFNDNIELPELKLDTKGSGQLLNDVAQLSDVANRYASAMNDGSISGKLAVGTFAPSQATTGAITSAAEFLGTNSVHGTASVHWSPRPGGQAVALTEGVLVFASVQETKTIHEGVEGTKFYFVIQDAKRLVYGGLLPPGDYGDISQELLVSIAVVVSPKGWDVVGQNATLTTIDGIPYRHP